MDYITCVGVLFIYRLFTGLAADLIVFRVTYIIYIIVLLAVDKQTIVSVEMVNEFAVCLLFQTFRYIIVADKFLYHCLKHYVETLGKQVFAVVCGSLYLISLVEECIA